MCVYLSLSVSFSLSLSIHIYIYIYITEGECRDAWRNGGTGEQMGTYEGKWGCDVGYVGVV